jgi:hypothetical protein
MSAVAQYLPADRRDEITRELRANILDRLEHMREELGRAVSDSEVASVLREMGHPQRVATRFLPPECLVSEEWFPRFKVVLYYTLMAFFIIHLVKVGAVFLHTGHFSFNQLVFGFTDTALLIFASITGVFYVLSNPPGGKTWFMPYAHWTPEQLPPAQQAWQRISFGEQASELALNLFFLLVLHYSLWASADALASVSVTFAPPVMSWIPWMTALVVLSMLLNLWNFRYGYWTQPKLVISGLITLGCAVVLFFVSRLPEIMVLTPGAELKVWGVDAANEFSAVGFLITSLWLLYEAGKDFYRASLLRSTTVPQ